MALTEAEAEVAANVAAAFFDEQAPVVEAPPVAVSDPDVDDTAPDPQAVAETEPAPEATSFQYTPDVPEDVLRELEEADIDEQVEAELASRTPEPEDDYGVVEDEDTVRERIKLQKRNEYLERELAKTRSTAWQDEALKYFPLSKHALKDIDATSRRSFLKQAKAEHEKLLPHVQEVLAEAKGFIDAEKSAARDAGKQQAKAAYGEPLTGPDVNEIDQAAANAQIDAAREAARTGKGDLAGVFRKMIQLGK